MNLAPLEDFFVKDESSAKRAIPVLYTWRITNFLAQIKAGDFRNFWFDTSKSKPVDITPLFRAKRYSLCPAVVGDAALVSAERYPVIETPLLANYSKESDDYVKVGRLRTQVGNTRRFISDIPHKSGFWNIPFASLELRLDVPLDVLSLPGKTELGFYGYVPVSQVNIGVVYAPAGNEIVRVDHLRWMGIKCQADLTETLPDVLFTGGSVKKSASREMQGRWADLYLDLRARNADYVRNPFQASHVIGK